MAKKITFITPPGIAVFPKLNEVDVYTPTDKKGRVTGAEKRQFVVRIKFDDADHRKVDAFLKKAAASLGAEDGCKLPWVKDKKDGTLSLKATSGEKYRPLVVDAQNNPLPKDVVVGGGSKIRVDVTVNYYDGFGGGINLYINAVQVLDLKQNDRKINFDAADGFTYTGEESESASGSFDSHTASDGDMDDDIPF